MIKKPSFNQIISVSFVSTLIVYIFSWSYFPHITKINLNSSSSNQSVTSIDTLFLDNKTLWWPGLTGEVPRYIPSGSLRGLGWQEVPMNKLKQELKRDYDLNIIDWYVSPSRLEYEFKANRRPICIYPYKWNDPEKEFSGPLKHLYSYGVTFGGDQKLSVFFRTSQFSKFEKHFDTLGNLKIESLLNDTALKTNLVKGYSYEPEILDKIEINAKTEWKIKNKYTKQLSLMVASENSQLLKMLLAGRIDYVFSHLPTLDQVRKITSESDNIDTLTYRYNRVQSPDDKNMVYYSVRCTNHPISKKIMPLINKYIDREFSQWGQWRELDWELHRQKIEDGYESKFSVGNSIRARFKLQHEWYNKYGLDKILSEPFSLRKQTVTSQSDETIVLPKRSRDFDLVLVQKEQHYFILKKSQLYLAYYEDCIGDFGSPTKSAFNLKCVLRDDEIEILSKQKNNSTLYKISDTSISEAKSLVLNSWILTPTQLRKILKQFDKISDLKLLYPRKELVQVLKDFYPPSLRNLAIIGGDLHGINLFDALKTIPMEGIDFHGSSVDQDDLIKIMNKHSKTLRHIGISGLRAFINDRFFQTFSQNVWPKLKSIDFSHNLISETNWQIVLRNFPQTVQHFKAYSSNLFPQLVKQIFTRCKDLRSFSVNWLFFNSVNDPILSFPKNIERVEMFFSAISDDDLKNLVFPNTLKYLHLDGTSLSDEGLAYLGAHIQSSLETLNLSLKNVSKQGITKLFNFQGKPYSWIKSLKNLTLFRSKLTTEHLKMIIAENQSLESLVISDNLLSGDLSPYLRQLNHLKNLNIGTNFINKDAFRKIMKSLPPKIETLYINSLLGFDVEIFLQNIPQHLYVVDISSNNLTIDEVNLIFRTLTPKGITVKNMNNRSSPQTIRLELKDYPDSSDHSYIEAKEIEANELISLIQALPNHVKSIHFNIGTVKGFVKPPPLLFPRSLMMATFSFKKFTDQRMVDEIMTKSNLSLKGLTFEASDVVQVNSFMLNKWKTLEFLDFLFHFQADRTLVNSLVQELPHTIKAIFLFAPFWTDEAGAKILATKTRLTSGSFSTGQIANNHSSESMINIINNGKKINQLAYLRLSGKQYSDAVVRKYKNAIYPDLVRLDIFGTSITGKGLIELLKNTKNLQLLNFQSSALSPEEVDDVIKALPRSLFFLDVSGNLIGERGRLKFKQWQKQQKNELGFPVGLNY